MDRFRLCTPCLFGVEGIAGKELQKMNMQDIAVENGRVLFSGSASDIARANILLRTGERILIIAGEFNAVSFDELFEKTRAVDWERYIPSGDAFPVKGYSLNSTLHSVPDCQRIIKKAVAERLKAKYGGTWLAEGGPKHQIQFSIMNDFVTLYIDTSGPGLHKRGYRAVGNAAPLRETLASAMILLSRYKGKEDFYDPFCGSGTIAIEAALIAKNRAPGLQRKFSAEAWTNLPTQVWKEARTSARDHEFSGSYHIYGSDIDPDCVALSKDNAAKAGVSDIIKFYKADAQSFSSDSLSGIIVTNPPYGERMLEQNQAAELYHNFGTAVLRLKNFRLYIISSHPEFEACFCKRAIKKRKLYNGMIKCNLFMYQ